MTDCARWARRALAGLLLTIPSIEPARSGEPEPPPAKMPPWVVVKPGKADPKAPRPVAPTGFAIEVGTVGPDVEFPIEIPIRNTSEDPIKILGGGSGCSPDGCIRPASRLPMTVPPGASATMILYYKSPRTQREFHCEFPIYIGGRTTFRVPVNIDGKVELPRPPANTR